MAQEEELRKRRCCFAGQRAEKLPASEEEIRGWLRNQILLSVQDGYSTFITGMSMGADLWAAQIVLDLKKEYPELKLIAACPYPGFERRWNETWQAIYQTVLKQADLVKYISARYDEHGCENRNCWMIEHSNRVIAVCYTEGSAMSLVQNAKTQGLQIVHNSLNDTTAEKKKLQALGFPMNLLVELFPGTDISLPADAEKRAILALGTLNHSRLPEILWLRFHDCRTFQQIGDQYGISRERARQLVEKGLKLLSGEGIAAFLKGESNCDKITFERLEWTLEHLI